MADERQILVVGEDTFPWHRLEDKADAFQDILRDVGEVHVTTDRDALGAADAYAAVVDYLTNSTLTTAQLTRLCSSVDGGGGYVGVHAAGDLQTIASDNGELLKRPEPHAKLREFLGGHFLTHPEQGEFTVRIDRDHPITRDVDAFTVFDEPYQVAWDDDVDVLARMDHPDLDAYPVLWTKRYGDGRVCYLSLGHTDEAFGTEGFRRLLRNAVDWAAGTA